MSYTTEDLVSRHLAIEQFPLPSVNNQPIVLEGLQAVSLHAGGVDDSLVVVKGCQSSHLTRTTLTLGDNPTFIGSTYLRPESVVIASDSSLGIIFHEHTDFTVDYQSGYVSILSAGSLNAGDTVTAWYQAYHVFQRSVDYVVDPQRGTLARLASGAIVDGQTVLVDYTPAHQSLTNDLISAAVNEANSLVAAQVDPGREFGADPSLEVAATNRALAILCRGAAARELSRTNADDRLAVVWLKLSTNYDQRADDLLKNFRPPFTGPAAPART